MNVKLLRKIQKHILAEPRRFDMGDWGAVTDLKSDQLTAAERKSLPPCGTVGCIAGTAIILKAKKADLKIELKNATESNYGTVEIDDLIPRTETYFEAGARLLDLTNEQASKLFYVDEWPETFSDKYFRTTRPAIGARIAVERIDHFIKTHGAE